MTGSKKGGGKKRQHGIVQQVSNLRDSLAVSGKRQEHQVQAEGASGSASSGSHIYIRSRK